MIAVLFLPLEHDVHDVADILFIGEPVGGFLRESDGFAKMTGQFRKNLDA